jgi:hypothetical protein
LGEDGHHHFDGQRHGGMKKKNIQIPTIQTPFGFSLIARWE